MKTRNVALIIFYDENKRILLQDRLNISKYGEEWGFFGGEIKEGETPEEAKRLKMVSKGEIGRAHV